jgi:hypothetical protein
MHIALDGRRVRVVQRPGMPPIFDEIYPTEAEANEAAQGIAKQLRNIGRRRQEESQRRWRESNERFIARLRLRRMGRRAAVIHVPPRREREPRPRPRRARRAGTSRDGPPRLAEDDEPPLAGVGGLVRR